MEAALNMGAFKELNQQEMQEVDGGWFILAVAIGLVCLYLIPPTY